MPSSESSLLLPPDARDLLRAFCERNVRFVVVGAHALGYWAQPRATGDFDLFVDPRPDNARRILEALADFGVPLSDLTADDLTRPGTVFQMGEPPCRIDLATDQTGITFDEAWEGHARVEIEGLSIPIIGREAMIRNKRATGRPKDHFDLELLGE
jgi:predicted nucleotidyltransferase